MGFEIVVAAAVISLLLRAIQVPAEVFHRGGCSDELCADVSNKLCSSFSFLPKRDAVACLARDDLLMTESC